MTHEPTTRTDPPGAPEAAGPSCAFCVPPTGGGNRSILLAGRHHYVLAPLGQLIEGFLLIMPYTCRTDDGRLRRCVAQLSDDELDELAELMDVVSAFYQSAYGQTSVTFYEQGRAGGGLDVDGDGRFYHHAHMCCVPAWADLRPVQEVRHHRIDVPGVAGIAQASARRPYLYLELRRTDLVEAAVFVGRDGPGTRALENARFRIEVAEHLGLQRRGNWRHEDDPAERDAVLGKFRRFMVGEIH